MSAPRGRTYRLQIDVFAEEFITILEDGSLILEDAVTGDYVAVTAEDLDSFAISSPPYTAHIAKCVREQLLDDTHDHCSWEWNEHPSGGWWYRSGRCPTCNPPARALTAGPSFLKDHTLGDEPDKRDTQRLAWIYGAHHVRLRPWLTMSLVEHPDQSPHVVVHDGPTGPALHFDSDGGPSFVSSEALTHLAWSEVLSNDDGWARAWGPEDRSGKFTPRGAAYHALAALVCLGDDWQVSPARFVAGDEHPLSVSSLESYFHSAQAAMIDYLELLETQFNEGVATGRPEYWHEPMWVGLRNGQPLILIDEAGTLHKRDQRCELPSTAEEIEALVRESVIPTPVGMPKLPRELRRATGVRIAADGHGTASPRVHERRNGVKASERALPRVTIPQPSRDAAELEGGQHEWVWAVPLPYRAISAPWSGATMPAAPASVGEDDNRFGHQLGYYASLFSFLTYSFAWTRPDKGLLWWYREGRPIDDERLALIRNSWDEDGNVIGFLAWLSTKPASLMSTFTLAPWARVLDESPLRLDTDWRHLLNATLRTAPWNGGHDPFHLGTGGHIAAPSQSAPHEGADVEHSRILAFDPNSRTATYISETISGWYANLFAAGKELPESRTSPSWRVDVYVKPIGFMGTYRQSRATGLWFAGRHRYHAVGN